jgi:hypothetical protein
MSCDFDLGPNSWCTNHDTNTVTLAGDSVELCKEHQQAMHDLIYGKNYCYPLWADLEYVEPGERPYFRHEPEDLRHQHKYEPAIIAGYRYCIRCGLPERVS